MATNLDELTAAESVFMSSLVLKGDKVEVTYDLQTVTIDGVIVGTFDGQKSIYASDWTAAQDLVSKSAAKLAGISILGTVCSGTNEDLITVLATKAAMNELTGQTNVPMLFANGNTLTLADDADLTTFLAAWLPFRYDAATGYSYEPVEI